MKITRTQPPVGYRVGLRRIARAAIDATSAQRTREGFERELKAYLGVSHAFAVSSGKTALTTILRTLQSLTGRRTVILPAYTCYSVPSAIVRAGLKVAPCDLAPGSFDYDYGRLQTMLGPDVLCVLSIHLFGIPSDTARLNDLCRSKGIFVVEDAAQAMNLEWGARKLGTIGDIGFFSFGRGKNVTCGSGGAIVTRSGVLGAAVGRRLAALPDCGAISEARAALTLSLLSLFISPALYWLPSGLPFLRLGETIFHEDFEMRRLSPFQAAVLRGWPELLRTLNGVRIRHAAYYTARLESARESDATVPYLRFPLFVDPSERERLLANPAARAHGISPMYPASVAGIAQLGATLRRDDYPEAERVAATLVTLPTHPLLAGRDLARVCELVGELHQVRGLAVPRVSQTTTA